MSLKKMLLALGGLIAVYGLMGVIVDYRDTAARLTLIVGVFWLYGMWVWGYTTKCTSATCGRYWAAYKTPSGERRCRHCGHEILRMLRRY